jgi:hypothetical protein
VYHSFQQKKVVCANLLHMCLGNENIAQTHIDTESKTDAIKGRNYYLSDLKSDCNNGIKLL